MHTQTPFLTNTHTQVEGLHDGVLSHLPSLTALTTLNAYAHTQTPFLTNTHTQVEGLHDGVFLHLSSLTALTALSVLPAPHPPSLEPADACGLPSLRCNGSLTQAGIAHCSVLTSLKTLDWASWSSERLLLLSTLIRSHFKSSLKPS